MVTSRVKMVFALLVTVSVCQVAAAQGTARKVSHPVSAMRQPTKTPGSQAELQAERDQIWNSPDMLRARAWLKDYCSKSAKVTPEMAKQYETELTNMTPNQMRLWLMKFDEQEQQRQQQWAAFQQYNAAGLQQAAGYRRQTQQAYAAINQEETAAAQNTQQQLNEQQESEQNMQENRMFDNSGAYGYPYNYGPWGYGGIHYHYHLYQ